MSTPRFLTDEDVHAHIIASVRRLEPSLDLLRVVDVGKSGAADEDVLEFAETENRLLVSHDAKTMKAAAEKRIASGRGIAGLFLAPKKKPIQQVAESIVFIWAASAAEEWRDQIVFLPL